MRLHSNKYVEALLYITIPLIVHVALTPRLLRRTLRKTKALLVGNPDRGYVVREISATTTFYDWHTRVLPSDTLNYMLQRALAEFLADKMQLEANRTNTVYQLMDKPFDDKLQAVKTGDDDDSTTKSDAGTDDDDSDDSSDNYYVKAEYTYEQLLQLRVTAAPAAETWVEITPGVFFQYVLTGNGDSQDEEPDEDAYDRRVTMTFRLRSKLLDASEAIDALVQSAFFEYKKRQILKSAQDTSRYMFVQTIQEQKKPASETASDSGDKEAAAMTVKKLVFKRYPLGDDKSFKNLFFQDKPRILHLLDNFTQRKGKFAVKGFPYKLGLLLHGPPGTGKTSLIKAVAQHTSRHIVSISLAKIKTNQELMDAMFDLRFPIEGRDTPIVLDFKDVVFVMEDIDCAGASVVHARASEKEPEKDGATGRRRRSVASSIGSDKLNLSGLLNVLDGVIDCPGRIVIMTTNHPEKLDPALIRPGRVNAQLLLGPMASPQVVEMLEYYFSKTLTRSERENVVVSTTGALLTPARVEEICAEFDTVEDAICALSTAVSA
jgi:mitochondrial chaperone BCS1